jgi:flagellar basal-body rod protein FlgB
MTAWRDSKDFGAAPQDLLAGASMPISDIPIFSMLRTRMHWHQERQRLLSENFANADTPKFRPRDLAPPQFDSKSQAVAAPMLARTSSSHMTGSTDPASRFQSDNNRDFEIRPSGNAVSLEDEMLKVASNAMDHQAASQLYARGLGLIKSALGRR